METYDKDQHYLAKLQSRGIDILMSYEIQVSFHWQPNSQTNRAGAHVPTY